MAKHPVPKQKTSKGRTSRRFKAFQNRARIRLADAVNLKKCSNCGDSARAHHICESCGFYRGKDVQGKVAKAEEKITTIKAD
ncbi:50S ribosomal protein L32 [Candidatus Peregrinibacteria bacterium]|jgi:large subunit ribosomal protein L32|nr:50S ribosomal protein L32 [Candidatus Peregrinibacteria bacterium]MBT4631367.1 50S ribosomal protein L32 [Candidatus Peregrinibacteria bacterium]MBT5517176.1 50S ribosomal protein L32 [Candidatus Peregrinibacteria bacterium]MBT5823758.1 50S ribosomal protein L32 [Candidatus Peregrinibacteria bacterium]